MFYQLPKNLSDLDHFRSNPMVQFKEETVGGVDVVIPCYMIADAEFWKIPYALELRGHVFRKDTGELISAALPKFFNVGENEFTQRHDLPWHTVTSIADKVDGSMITFANINGKIYAKTKKSFYSDVAKEAQKVLDEDRLLQRGIQFGLSIGMSPVYEFYHPDWQVVINYGDKPAFKYLGYRRIVTGEWIPYDNVTGIPLHDLENWQDKTEGVEGLVIQFADGRVVKAKTKWYLQQHRVRTQMRERDVAELAALEQLDDVKSLVTDAGLDLSKIEWIEKEVAKIIGCQRASIEDVVNRLKPIAATPKEAADICQGLPDFGMIMRTFRGQEVNYVEWFLRHKLQEFSLKNVYNEKF